MKRRVFLAFAALAACSDLRSEDFIVAEKNGEGIQAAIDAAAVGGGRVVVTPGNYESGTLYLRSNVELHIDEGAVICGKTSAADYSDVQSAEGLYPENSKKAFLVCEDCRNVSITGAGTIDGRGVSFYDASRLNGDGFFEKPECERPRMLQFLRCRNVRLSGVTLKDSPCWTVWFRRCEDVDVSGIAILGDSRMINNDGIDIDACRRVRVRKSRFDTADDCLVLRAIRSPNGSEAVCEDVLVEDCVLKSRCQCVRIGCPSDDTIRDATFRRIKSKGRNAVFSCHPYQYLSPGDRGYLRTANIVFEDWEVDCYGFAVCLSVDSGIKLRDFGHFVFRDFKVCAQAPIRLRGCAESMLVDLTFDGFSGSITDAVPFEIRSVSGLSLNRFALTSGAGKKGSFRGAVGGSWETSKGSASR